MTEILWHGRGGQGAFTASKLLGAAYALQDNNYSLAFPSFGPERRGAPILAFTKLDKKSIGDRSQIKKADYVVFLDDTLFTKNAFCEIKPNGKIFINTKKNIEELLSENGTETTALNTSNSLPKQRDNIILYDGDSIATRVLGLAVSNTVMLGLLAKEENIVSKEDLIKAINLYMGSKIAAKNTILIEEIFGGAK